MDVRDKVALVEAAGGRRSSGSTWAGPRVSPSCWTPPVPDVLVNDAGGGAVLRPCFPEAGPERWGAALDLNLRAPMLATQRVLEPMRERGGGGGRQPRLDRRARLRLARLARVQRGQGRRNRCRSRR